MGRHVGEDPALDLEGVERRAAAVHGLLDQHAAGGEREQVDEPVAVGLRDRRVHEQRQRPGAVRLQRELEAHELLVAGPRRRDLLRSTRVEHHATTNQRLVVEPDQRRADLSDPPVEKEADPGCRQPGRHRLGKALAGDGRVPDFEDPVVAGKADLLARPLPRHERRHQGPSSSPRSVRWNDQV